MTMYHLFFGLLPLRHLGEEHPLIHKHYGMVLSPMV